MITGGAIRVLVTGASGFIGGHLTKYLGHAGHLVTGLFYQTAVPAVNCPENVRFISGSVVEFEGMRAIVRQFRPDVIVHGAAIAKPDECEAKPELAYRVNVEGSLNILRAVDEFAPDCRVIALSTDLVFDGYSAIPEGSSGFGEGDSPRPVSVYAQTKRSSEEILVDRGSSAVVLRLALSFGCGSGFGASFLDWIIERGKRGESIPLFTDEWRTPLYVSDLSRLIGLLVKVEPDSELWCSVKGKILHAGGLERVTRFEFGKCLAQVVPALNSLIVPVVRGDIPSLAARPADVSLDSRLLWRVAGLGPKPLKQAFSEIFLARDLV